MEINATQVCEELLIAMTQLKTSMYRVAESFDLRPQQFHILHYLDIKGDLTMGQLAQALHCDPSNITGMIDRLVNNLVVERRECPHDRRAKTLVITDKGRSLIADIRKALPAKLGCTKLSPAQLHSLHEIISVLSQ